jgi:hypothetical protein
VTTNAIAWVCYNGNGSAIRSSYNISSVTKNGTGDYTLNFATALSDANYATIANGTVDVASGAYQYFTGITGSSGTPLTKTTTAVRMESLSFTGAAVDSQQYSVVIFGN